MGVSMREGYFHWGRRGLPVRESRALQTAFWRGARYRFHQTMFVAPVAEQQRSRWVRQVHAWFQEVVTGCFR